MSPVWRALLPGGVVTAFIVFLSSFAGVKKFALQGGYPVDAGRELEALGAANVLGAFFGAVPVQVGLSRMAIAYDGGVTSCYGCNVIVAFVIVFISTFLTPLFYYVPQSTLAAIIISGATGLIDMNIVRYLWRYDPELRKKRGFWIHVSAFLGTLVVGVAQGILFPIGISLLLLIKDATKLRIHVLGRVPRTKLWRPKSSWKTAKSLPDILVLRIDGNLTFSNADALFEGITSEVRLAKELLKIVAEKAFSPSRPTRTLSERGGKEEATTPTRGAGVVQSGAGSSSPLAVFSDIEALILDVSNVPVLDFSALAVFEELAQAWRAKGKLLILAGAQGKVSVPIAIECSSATGARNKSAEHSLYRGRISFFFFSGPLETFLSSFRFLQKEMISYPQNWNVVGFSVIWKTTDVRG